MSARSRFGMILAAAACACGGGGDSPASPGGGGGTGAVATVTVDAVAAPVIIGDSVRLVATAKDSHGAVIAGRTVTWSSSAPDIVQVTSGGFAIGAGLGTATITATVEGKSGTTTVTGGLDPALSLSVAIDYSCALTAAGAAYCWGSNALGQLGANDPAGIKQVGPVAGGLVFTEISINTLGGCGVTTTHAGYCWGSLTTLGNGSTNTSRAPVAVSGGLQFRSIVVGGRFACGLTLSRTVYCWGENQDGQLAIPAAPALVTTPGAVAQVNGLTFVQISAGNAHMCGVTPAGAVHCWGSNRQGQAGPLGVPVLQFPALVPGGLLFRRVSAGVETTCGVTTNDAVYCWGTNDFGSLGNGTTGLAVVGAPTAVPALATGVVGVGAGTSSSQHAPMCAWTQGGAGSCWGSNNVGQLGTNANLLACAPGNVICAPAPTAVVGITDFTAIAGAADHTCGMTKRHTVYCWGVNTSGQLGDGTLNPRFTSVAVVGLPATP